MIRKRWKKTALIMSIALLAPVFITACGNRREPTPAEQVSNAAEAVEQVENEVQTATDNSAKDSVLQDYTGDMDLTGSWDDEISQRASMEVTPNDDGSYDIRVHWGGSANETSVWEIHGTYDPVSGMLGYEDGAYSIHSWDANNKETVSGEERTKGAFMKEGDKLRWSDSKNSEDGVFVKVK